MFAGARLTSNYLYAGEQLDPNVGFYYLRARYYDQATGRFVSADPFQGNVFDPISLHRYLYANGEPTSHVDPSGENATVIFFASLALSMILLTYLFHPRSSIAKRADLRRTTKFTLTLCAGAITGGSGGGGGSGGAVISERGEDRARSAKYEYTIGGLAGGFSVANASTSDFETATKSSPNDFAGEGKITSAAVGAAYVFSLSAAWYELPEGTYVSSPPSFNIGVDKARKGASAVLGGMDWSLKIRALEQSSSDLCATNTRF